MSTWRAFVRLLCVCALLALAFAHRPIAVQAADLPVEELAAYTLPDGTVPVLCLAGTDHGDHEQHSGFGSTGCEACRLSAAILLPVPPLVGVARAALSADVPLPPRVEAFVRQLFPPNAAPRAPPSVTVT